MTDLATPDPEGDGKSAGPGDGPRVRRRLTRRTMLVVLLLSAAWILLVWLPVARLAWSFASHSGSTPLELLLPADPTYRLSASVDGHAVTGTGQTSLPDGSHIHMWATYWGDAPGIHISDPSDAVVLNGAFHATFDLSGWPAGEVAVNALFELDGSQPAEATARYGEDGARLSGPRVAFDDDNQSWALQDWQTVWLGPQPLVRVPTPEAPSARDPGTFAAVGNMSAARSGHQAVLLRDGRVLVVGGDLRCDQECVLHPTADVFDPATGQFTPTQPMVQGRQHATASLLPNGRVLVAGGYDQHGDAMASAEVYDPATGMFQAAPSMSTPRAGHTATALADGRVLLVGGVGSLDEGTLGIAELYDPTSGRFVRAGSLNAARSDHTATLLANGRVLIVGGVGDLDILASAELFDPQADEFRPTGSMTQVRQLQAATVLSDGRVLIAGGLGTEDQGQVASAEVYDPGTGTFAAVGSMIEGRNFLTATLLRDGRVLIAGGFFRGDVVASAELFDPGTNEFARAGKLSRPSDAPTATLLGDGRVLITGGYGNGGDVAPAAEVYQPGG
jgi:hypothetical protein